MARSCESTLRCLQFPDPHFLKLWQPIQSACAIVEITPLPIDGDVRASHRCSRVLSLSGERIPDTRRVSACSEDASLCTFELTGRTGNEKKADNDVYFVKCTEMRGVVKPGRIDPDSTVGSTQELEPRRSDMEKRDKEWGQVENRDLDTTTVGKSRAILTTIHRDFGGARARVSMVCAVWNRRYHAYSYVGSSSRLCVSWRVSRDQPRRLAPR